MKILVAPSIPDAWGVARGNVESIMVFGFIPVVRYQGSIFHSVEGVILQVILAILNIPSAVHGSLVLMIKC